MTAAAMNTDTTATGKQEIAPASEGKYSGNPILCEDHGGLRATSHDYGARHRTNSPGGTVTSLVVTPTSERLGTPAQDKEEKYTTTNDPGDGDDICSSSSSNSSNGGWDSFYAAFGGKTAINTTIPTMISSVSGEERGRGGEATTYPGWASRCAFSSNKETIGGGIAIIQDKEGLTEISVSVDDTGCEEREEEGGEGKEGGGGSSLLYKDTIFRDPEVKEQHRQRRSNTQCSLSPSLPLVGLWERKRSTRRWVDQCALMTSSSDGSVSSCASSFDLEDGKKEDVLVPNYSAMVEEDATTTAQLQVGSTSTSLASATLKHCRHHDNAELKRPRGKQPRCEPSTSRARRITLSAYGGDPATAVAALETEQSNRNGDKSSPDGHGAFVWCIQLHGCLCEAPLAVLEGVIRAPCYFLAAAWVFIVGRVGASSPAQRENRDRLLGQAQALAREGALLLAACLTLSLPCATYFTIYGDARGEHVWDARPVPTILGSVDPLRFFVFAHGQAGELAANGRPEPLLSLPDHLYFPVTSPAAGNIRDSGANSTNDGVSLSGECQVPNRHNDNTLPWFTQSPSTKCYYFSPIAAQSMDTDVLGVGILHPPRDMEMRWKRAWASTCRDVVEAFWRLEGHVRSMVTRSRV